MAVAPEAPGALALDPAAAARVERLFNEHSGWIYGYCLRLLRSPEDAEDAVQATYLNAFRSLREGTRPRVDSAWLLRIAQNVCLTRLRSSGRRAKLEHLQDVTVLEETVPAPVRTADELIGLTDALATLPEQQRRAILLREWQGLSYREVAETLGLTQAAVETLVFRARRSLAEALEQPGKRRRRLLRGGAFDLGGLAMVLKGFLAGGVGVKAAAATAVAAVATTTTVVALDPVGIRSSAETERAAVPRAAAASPAAGAQSSVPTASSTFAPGDPAFSPVVGEPASERAVLGPEVAEEARRRGKAKGKATAPGRSKAPDEPADGKGKGHGQGQGNGQGNGTPAAQGQAPGSGAASGKGQGAAQPSQGQDQGGGAESGRDSGGPPSAGEQGPPPHAEGSPSRDDGKPLPGTSSPL